LFDIKKFPVLINVLVIKAGAIKIIKNKNGSNTIHSVIKHSKKAM
jgi:hypothetical protein